MTLAVGDHLVIKRGGAILTPDYGEDHHEFEVVAANYSSDRDDNGDYETRVNITARVVV